MVAIPFFEYSDKAKLQINLLFTLLFVTLHKLLRLGKLQINLFFTLLFVTLPIGKRKIKQNG